MPGRSFSCRRREPVLGRPQHCAVKIAIMFAVVEIGLQAMAHFEATVIGNRDIAQVKEPTNVGAQQQAVGALMLTTIRE